MKALRFGKQRVCSSPVSAAVVPWQPLHGTAWLQPSHTARPPSSANIYKRVWREQPHL